MNNFFSIVIPTLNEEAYLPKILESLLSQKEKNFEVIIVDARSEDKTKEAALSFSGKIPINFYEVQKRNVSFQRNYGAAKAKGKYVIFLDADAGITSIFTKNAKKMIIQKKGLVFIPYVIPDEDSKIDVEIAFNFVNFLIDMSQNIGKPLSSGGSMIFERNFFYNVGGFDESLVYAEDHNIIQKAQQWGVRAKFLRSIRIKFSLRRMRKEGRLKLLYKYILSTAYVLFKGKIKKKIYEYEMGGQFYKLPKDKFLKKGGEDSFKEYVKQINIYFKKIFIEE